MNSGYSGPRLVPAGSFDGIGGTTARSVAAWHASRGTAQYEPFFNAAAAETPSR